MEEIVYHHRVPRTRGGSNNDINLMKTPRKPECAMHTHEGVRVFHEKLIHALEWDGPILAVEARQKFMSVINELGPEMYNRSAFKHWDRDACWMFDKKKGVYIPKPYNQ